MSTLYAKGKHIYQAMVAGSKRKYNRSVDDYKFYEELLQGVFDLNVEFASKAGGQHDANFVAEMQQQGWREAYLPITFMCFHNHRAMAPCEKHVRIAARDSEGLVFVDIPLWHWDKLCKNGESVQQNFVTFV